MSAFAVFSVLVGMGFAFALGFFEFHCLVRFIREFAAWLASRMKKDR